jgi:peptidoglycan/xylan/chitin deacetylase (PgdA/CDA1 family)
MHDIHAPTVAAAPKLIKELKKRGYKMVTVEQLLGSAKSGKVYFRR